ncbi:hypothetical protein [Paratissierella segnis]|jgi:hypothetical protein|nr:hypothetical protein [Paratissierella segnis]
MKHSFVKINSVENITIFVLVPVFLDGEVEIVAEGNVYINCQP